MCPSLPPTWITPRSQLIVGSPIVPPIATAGTCARSAPSLTRSRCTLPSEPPTYRLPLPSPPSPSSTGGDGDHVSAGVVHRALNPVPSKYTACTVVFRLNTIVSRVDGPMGSQLSQYGAPLTAPAPLPGVWEITGPPP